MLLGHLTTCDGLVLPSVSESVCAQGRDGVSDYAETQVLLSLESQEQESGC